jgi:hypothetical protein
MMTKQIWVEEEADPREVERGERRVNSSIRGG